MGKRSNVPSIAKISVFSTDFIALNIALQIVSSRHKKWMGAIGMGSVCRSHFGFRALSVLTLELRIQSPNSACSFSTMNARLSSEMDDLDLNFKVTEI